MAKISSEKAGNPSFRIGDFLLAEANDSELEKELEKSVEANGRASFSMFLPLHDEQHVYNTIGGRKSNEKVHDEDVGSSKGNRYKTEGQNSPPTGHPQCPPLHFNQTCPKSVIPDWEESSWKFLFEHDVPAEILYKIMQVHIENDVMKMCTESRTWPQRYGPDT